MVRDNTRPIFLELLRIHQPITAIVSITHRITGVLLFLLVPLLIYSLELALSSPAGFDAARLLWSTPAMRLVAILALWWFAYHLFAGLRFLLIDIEVGLEKTTAMRSGWLVLAAGLLVLLIVGGRLL
jgi:succinate dehydrogenase / fumarate reductase cytochrome b subunit